MDGGFAPRSSTAGRASALARCCLLILLAALLSTAAAPASAQPLFPASSTVLYPGVTRLTAAPPASSSSDDDELAAPGEQPARLAPTKPPLDSGEYGVEYQLARQAADSFLNRVGAWFKGIVRQATSWIGTPYRRGGGSRRGIDCSGLTGIVFAQQGIELPRTAAQQFALGAVVAATELQPGDLVFFRNTYKRGISHVGIYAGDGRFIHAAGRRQGVIVSALARPYYQRRFAGARRLTTPPLETLASLPPGSSTAPAAPAGLGQ